MTKLIHLKSSVAGLVPAPSELVEGQFAINTNDKLVFFLAHDGTVVTINPSAAGTGTVKSVNSKTPDGSGNVTLVPTDLGASTLGSSLFTAASAAAARTSLGSTTVGDALFTASNSAAALATLGSSAVGRSVFTATDAPTAVSALGGTSVGSSVFTAASTGAAQTAIGATAVGSNLLTAASTNAVVTYLGVVPTSQIGVASGVASLDTNGKIPTSQLPASVLGSVNYQGTFTPGTSTLPTAGAANKGWYYVATSGGTYTPPGGVLLTFNQGDWLISDGTQWAVLDSQDAVTAVNGKIGNVTLAATDITTGIFGAAQLGASSGNNLALTTSGTGAPTWVAQLPATNLGLTPAANTVLITPASGGPTWAATVPTANLPVATAAALGLAQAGSGLSVAAGVFSVNTSALVLDEGTFTGS